MGNECGFLAREWDGVGRVDCGVIVKASSDSLSTVDSGGAPAERGIVRRGGAKPIAASETTADEVIYITRMAGGGMGVGQRGLQRFNSHSPSPPLDVSN